MIFCEWVYFLWQKFLQSINKMLMSFWSAIFFRSSIFIKQSNLSCAHCNNRSLVRSCSVYITKCKSWSVNKENDTKELTVLTALPLKLSCVPSLKIYGSFAFTSNRKGTHLWYVEFLLNWPQTYYITYRTAWRDWNKNRAEFSILGWSITKGWFLSPLYLSFL